MSDETTALANIEGAHRMLTNAKTLPDVLRVHDVAAMLRSLARQARLSLETQNMAAELRIRAERKSGELLKETIPHGGGRPAEKPSSDVMVFEPPPKLSDLGITPNQSSTWQRIADIPEDRFEQHIEATKAAGEELTTAGTLRLAEELAADEERTIEVVPTPFRHKFSQAVNTIAGADPNVRAANAAAAFAKWGMACDTLLQWDADEMAAAVPVDDLVEAICLPKLDQWLERYRMARTRPRLMKGSSS